MGDAAKVPKKMTVEDFFIWVEKQPIPYELIDGEPRPHLDYVDQEDSKISTEITAGPSYDHELIIRNVILSLQPKLKGGTCTPIGSQVSLVVNENTTFFPDIAIDCGFKERPAKSRALVKPVLLAEVLSTSTRNYDLVNKREAYENIDTIEYIMFIEQDKPLVKVHRRLPENAWITQPYSGLASTINLQVLNLQLNLSDIYEDINFSSDV